VDSLTQLEPQTVSYSNLMGSYIALNRLDKAQAAYDLKEYAKLQ